MTPAESDLILDKSQILQKITRIAYEIYENNIQENELVIAGIAEGGYKLAEILIRELKKITPFKLCLVKISLDKQGPLDSPVILDCETKEIKDKVIILVDDVLHTGKTFIQGMKPFLAVNVKKIQTVVLVNRSYTLFPVTSNYTGYQLSTTLNDHIQVQLEKNNFGVYLY
ncbi:MAG: phosphoribosyltransferase [Cyclobacteriaceae bacterium]|nr:phosphoribosyltransferase [Cyclobacteriaceae bacterium]